jgi:heparan-alpha-glucosaminide N-acetyltransferase
VNGERVRSLDVARGVAVGGMLYLTYIPGRDYGFAVHAEWWGLTLYDVVLPMFLVLFGVALGFSYRADVRWERVGRRTVGLVVIGLGFNAVVGWDADLSTLRLTGVLQAFAVAGLSTTAVLWATRRWWVVGVVGVGLVAAHGAALWAVGRRCPGGLPTPECNLSALVDPAVFGTDHLYAGGAAGYDPEGLGVIVGVAGSVLGGAAAARPRARRGPRGAVAGLLAVGCGLIVLAVAVTPLLPVGKRPWTPSFALLTAGASIVTLAVCHLLVDRRERGRGFVARMTDVPAWLLEAVGRNSLLVYVGMFVLVAVLANVEATLAGETASVGAHLLDAFAWSPRAELTYAAALTGMWVAVAAGLHRVGWYWRP